MNLQILSIILNLSGELIIAIAILRVHSHMLKEHRLDSDVYRVIKKEKKLVLVGIFFLISGSALQIFTI